MGALAMLKTQRFNSAQEMRQTIERYVHLYNQQLPQSTLQSRTPVQQMKRCYDENLSCFSDSPEHPIGRDATSTKCLFPQNVR